MRALNRSTWPLWLLVLAGLAFLVARPLYELIHIAVAQFSTRGQLALDLAEVLNSLLVGVVVTVAAVGLGAIAAFITERSAVRRRRWLRICILLPLLAPPFVSAMSWARAYGPSGLIDDALRITLPDLYGATGIIAVIAINTIPIVYLITVAALNSRNAPDLERAARIHGAGPLRAAASVTIPLLTPALLGAGALSFVAALNSFGVPAILGTPSGFVTVTTRIYQDLARSAPPEALRRAVLLATGLAVAALVLVALSEVSLGGLGGEGRTTTSSGPVVSSAKRTRWPGVGAWLFILLGMVIPFLALLGEALTKEVGLSPFPSNWTLRNFGNALTGHFLGSLGRSLLLAALAATAAVALGSAATALPRGRLGRPLMAAMLLMFALPASTIAVAVLLSYGRLLKDTLALILIAYVAKLWAIGHRSVLGSVRNLAPELRWAARSSGASAIRTAQTVTLPLLRPALLGGWILVFLFAFHELTMSSLLYGPGTDTLAVAILNLQQVGNVPLSSALAVILTVPTVLLAIPLLVVWRLPRRLLGTG